MVASPKDFAAGHTPGHTPSRSLKLSWSKPRDGSYTNRSDAPELTQDRNDPISQGDFDTALERLTGLLRAEKLRGKDLALATERTANEVALEALKAREGDRAIAQQKTLAKGHDVAAAIAGTAKAKYDADKAINDSAIAAVNATYSEYALAAAEMGLELSIDELAVDLQSRQLKLTAKSLELEDAIALVEARFGQGASKPKSLDSLEARLDRLAKQHAND